MAWFGRKSSTGATKPAQAAAPHSSHAGGDANGAAVVSGFGPEHDAAITSIGSEMLRRARGHKAGVFSSQFYSDALMEWSMKDQAFKVQLFRFVDTFPVLRNTEDTYDHLEDYLAQPGVTTPTVIAAAMKAGKLAKGLAVSQISKQITGMASKFIAGADAAGAMKNLRALWDEGIAFSVDLLGEACVSDAEADAYRDKYLDLINNLPGSVASWPASERLERDHLGAIPRTNVSVKISSLSARCDPIDAEGARRDLMKRLRPILEAAKARGVFVNFDMEQFAFKDFTLDLFMRCCEEVDFHAGLAMQAYLRSGESDARRICEWSVRTGRVVTVRLVKGAYWDYEVINAEQRGWPVPVWPTKRETDACFERMARIFVDSCPRTAGAGGVKLALGSHNVRSIAATVAYSRSKGLPDSAIELQMLHGMADQLKHAAAEMGLRMREYVPVGQMIPGMAYLVRRLLENTSNESWLKSGFLDNADEGKLLASPHGEPAHEHKTTGDANTIKTKEPTAANLERAPERHRLTPSVKIGGSVVRPFCNEAFRDFADAAQHKAFASAVSSAKVPTVRSDTSLEQARAMVARAHAAFDAWRDVAPGTRAQALLTAAEVMRARRDELAAMMIREAGKTWREADADVCEAIDFCEFYARESCRLFAAQRLGRFVGELDEQWHQPRGVAVVIAPWNFPLAICCGMAVAALVTGNTCVVKPAEQTPGIAKLLCEILWSAGAPREVLHFIAGQGETVGAALVRHPRTALVAFTGSKAVGLDIVSACGIPGDGFVKKVVCEMGGKNAIIVDASADLDEAVLGVRQSAFGFCGQKCSACSRVIVVDSAHDAFLHRLVGATQALVVGDPTLPGTDIGPVIDADAARKIASYVELSRTEGKLETQLPVPAGLAERVGKPYVGPAIISGIEPHHRLAREEIFGPVLAVMRARDFDHALELANQGEYKLTGGVYSRKPANLVRARREFRVGNLYLNRGITGALVGRQPFGGFGMSGLGSKAGGREYLLHFVEPRCVCENTMRRGFAPGLE
ncbi:MAG: proline dehydrogenase family protein [Phycisphaerales bacterium]